MNKLLLMLFILTLMSCGNPYKGFKGVNPKGMQKNTTPSQNIRNDYKKSEKKMQKEYKKEMKKRKRKMGTP